MELSLHFPKPDQLIVKLRSSGFLNETKILPYTILVPESGEDDLRWYMETYPVQYTTDVDDIRASSIASGLPHWGETLFQSVFGQNSHAKHLFDLFQSNDSEQHLITINSDHPEILRQPWELLKEKGDDFLVLKRSGSSIRRRLAEYASTKVTDKITPKDRLHLLFIVSRPDDTGLIDPRSDPIAILDAIEHYAAGRFEVEFLRPPTLRS